VIVVTEANGIWDGWGLCDPASTSKIHDSRVIVGDPPPPTIVTNERMLRRSYPRILEYSEHDLDVGVGYSYFHKLRGLLGVAFL